MHQHSMQLSAERCPSRYNDHILHLQPIQHENRCLHAMFMMNFTVVVSVVLELVMCCSAHLNACPLFEKYSQIIFVIITMSNVILR